MQVTGREAKQQCRAVSTYAARVYLYMFSLKFNLFISCGNVIQEGLDVQN